MAAATARRAVRGAPRERRPVLVVRSELRKRTSSGWSASSTTSERVPQRGHPPLVGPDPVQGGLGGGPALEGGGGERSEATQHFRLGGVRPRGRRAQTLRHHGFDVAAPRHQPGGQLGIVVHTRSLTANPAKSRTSTQLSGLRSR
jgi:hypothetical protein